MARAHKLCVRKRLAHKSTYFHKKLAYLRNQMYPKIAYRNAPLPNKACSQNINNLFYMSKLSCSVMPPFMSLFIHFQIGAILKKMPPKIPYLY